MFWIVIKSKIDCLLGNSADHITKLINILHFYSSHKSISFLKLTKRTKCKSSWDYLTYDHQTFLPIMRDGYSSYAMVACILFDTYNNLHLDNTLLYMPMQIIVFLRKCVTNH